MQMEAYRKFFTGWPFENIFTAQNLTIFREMKKTSMTRFVILARMPCSLVRGGMALGNTRVTPREESGNPVRQRFDEQSVATKHVS